MKLLLLLLLALPLLSAAADAAVAAQCAGAHETTTASVWPALSAVGKRAATTALVHSLSTHAADNKLLSFAADELRRLDGANGGLAASSRCERVSSGRVRWLDDATRQNTTRSGGVADAFTTTCLGTDATATLTVSSCALRGVKVPADENEAEKKRSAKTRAVDVARTIALTSRTPLDVRVGKVRAAAVFYNVTREPMHVGELWEGARHNASVTLHPHMLLDVASGNLVPFISRHPELLEFAGAYEQAFEFVDNGAEAMARFPERQVSFKSLLRRGDIEVRMRLPRYNAAALGLFGMHLTDVRASLNYTHRNGNAFQLTLSGIVARKQMRGTHNVWLRTHFPFVRMERESQLDLYFDFEHKTFKNMYYDTGARFACEVFGVPADIAVHGTYGVIGGSGDPRTRVRMLATMQPAGLELFRKAVNATQAHVLDALHAVLKRTDRQCKQLDRYAKRERKRRAEHERLFAKYCAKRCPRQKAHATCDRDAPKQCKAIKNAYARYRCEMHAASSCVPAPIDKAHSTKCTAECLVMDRWMVSREITERAAHTAATKLRALTTYSIGSVLRDGHHGYKRFTKLPLFPVMTHAQWAGFGEVLRTKTELRELDFELTVAPRGVNNTKRAALKVPLRGASAFELTAATLADRTLMHWLAERKVRFNVPPTHVWELVSRVEAQMRRMDAWTSEQMHAYSLFMATERRHIAVALTPHYRWAAEHDKRKLRRIAALRARAHRGFFPGVTPVLDLDMSAASLRRRTHHRHTSTAHLPTHVLPDRHAQPMLGADDALGFNVNSALDGFSTEVLHGLHAPHNWHKPAQDKQSAPPPPPPPPPPLAADDVLPTPPPPFRHNANVPHHMRKLVAEIVHPRPQIVFAHRPSPPPPPPPPPPPHKTLVVRVHDTQLEPVLVTPPPVHHTLAIEHVETSPGYTLNHPSAGDSEYAHPSQHEATYDVFPSLSHDEHEHGADDDGARAPLGERHVWHDDAAAEREERNVDWHAEAAAQQHEQHAAFAQNDDDSAAGDDDVNVEYISDM